MPSSFYEEYVNLGPAQQGSDGPTAEIGLFAWGDAQWGSIEAPGAGAWTATGTMSLNGAANLTLTAILSAVGTLALVGAGTLTTQILMGAVAELKLLGSADLRTGKRAAVLSTCGGPLAADCDQWLLAPFQRQA